MRKNIFAFLGIASIVLLGIYSCKKNNINGDSKDLIPSTILTLTKNINGNLDFSNPAATVSIQVGSKGGGAPIESVNLYLATGDALDKTKWKLIKNVPFTDGVTLSITTAQISAALAPDVIEAGNQYTIQNEAVLKDGRKVSALNTPTNFSSFPAYNIIYSWKATAICPFIQADAVGTYAVVYDGDWVDFNTGDLITVTAGPDANSLQFLAYPSPAAGGSNRTPWILKIDQPTGNTTVADQFVGNYGSVVARVSATGFVFSCTGFITLSTTVNYGGSLIPALFTLQKQ